MSMTVKAMRNPRAVSRASQRATPARRPFVVRSALAMPSNTAPKKSAPKAAQLTSNNSCSVNRVQAHEFNRCYINFDQLDEEHAYHCVEVADEILAVDCQTSICDDDICTEKEHVNWFKGYISNAFGF